MAKSLLDIITGREDRPIRPEAMQGRRTPFKLKGLADSAIYEGPEGELPEVVVTAKKEPPPKTKPTGGAFWATVRDVVAGALKAYSTSPGEYLRAEEAKTEAEKQRVHQKEMFWMKLDEAYKRQDAVALLRLIREDQNEINSIHRTILASKVTSEEDKQASQDALIKRKNLLTQKQTKSVLPKSEPAGKGIGQMTDEQIRRGAGIE